MYMAECKNAVFDMPSFSGFTLSPWKKNAVFDKYTLIR